MVTLKTYAFQHGLIIRDYTSADEIRRAVYSPDERYRYSLLRVWNPARPICCFILLNPSTATEVRDDPTVRRAGIFAKREGMGGVDILNIFAYRSRYPDVMKEQDDPVGIANDLATLQPMNRPHFTICGWGDNGNYRDRGQIVTAWLRSIARPGNRFYSLGPLSKAGHPRHPVYLPSAAAMLPYDGLPETLVSL